MGVGDYPEYDCKHALKNQPTVVELMSPPDLECMFCKVERLEIQVINLRHCVNGAHEMDEHGVRCRHCGKVLL